MSRKLKCEEVIAALREGPATSTQIIRALFNKGYYDIRSIRNCIRQLLKLGVLKREPDPNVKGFVYLLEERR